MIRLLHLTPDQLGLNGEAGNLMCMHQRLLWAGVESEIIEFSGGNFPDQIDAVFIGSGTLSGAIEALDILRPYTAQLRELSENGVDFLALGLGWEILGRSIQLVDGTVLDGVGIYPTDSLRLEKRASRECFGFDIHGNLTTGYANHSAEITCDQPFEPLITLSVGNGNSSAIEAPEQSAEGFAVNNLWAARLNGPLLPLNPHLADEFLNQVTSRLGISYSSDNELAERADGYAAQARSELRDRLAR